ncbi:hypothetical protein HMPREF9349_01805 [Escherichia coli MS 79-10]|nr:hypothetical protein HMPREF9551_03882 [Escherichia coli MS 196-1]EFK47200.1 hypothetical protein HMPREF9346_01065 [Escherichia coli MS 119-7]EGU98184.1 hypothetical protein HMPREF9349_01805 [Escherichia coli MS 79-10]ESD64941.1 hypothetical protein HMPREF1610_04527 [Escherichia coli 908555]ESD77566.1 hypothetical protein HMPREF1609_00994 [Escherichia coli 908541]ESE04607.1 hypothetical protein HMPREF1616_02800 [Escherichia coli 908658]
MLFMFAYSKLIIDNIAKNDGNLMIFRKRRKISWQRERWSCRDV